MLTFTLLLLALLSLGVSSGPSSMTPIPTSDFTNTTALLSDLDSCDSAGTPSTPAPVRPGRRQTSTGPLACAWPHNLDDDHFDCLCFGKNDDTYGVERRWIAAAIDQGYLVMGGGLDEPVEAYGIGEGLLQEFTYHWLYEATGDREEGQIDLTIKVDEDPACAGAHTVSREWCLETFRGPLDSCDAGGENGKNGGQLLEACLWWIVDPQPSVNRPYTFPPPESHSWESWHNLYDAVHSHTVISPS